MLSITPGNFFALKTWKGRVKTDAKTGAAEVLSEEELPPGAMTPPEEFAEAGVRGEVGFEGDDVRLELLELFVLAWERPTFTKLNFRL